jgi:glyoxylase-like metal-dependent hydrolase (beta-lactamase superfamily II)
MKMRAFVTVVAAAAAVSVSSGAAAQPRRAITQITDNLYAAVNDNHRAVFVVTGEGVILADPINADFATWLKGEIRARFDVPVRYVLYSHHHWDHASGGGVFADTARFVGQENMLGDLAMPPAGTVLPEAARALDADRDGRVQRSEATGDFAEAFALYDADSDGAISGPEATRGPLSDVRVPDVTFADRMTVALGDAEVELIHTGQMAHANDMSVIHFPGARAVFVVDFISLGRLPFQRLVPGQLNAWLNAIRGVERLDVDIVVPGHGVVGDLDDVAAHRGYIEELRDQVQAGVARGATLAELQNEILMTPYQGWISYEQWRPLNIEGMYRIVTGGAY